MMKNKLGIIAGEGKFPVLIAKEAAAKGIEVYVLGVKNNVCIEAFKDYCKKALILKVGQLNAAINFLKENGVTQAVMAGRVQHVNIFSVMPDLRAAKLLAKIKDMRAKSILGAAIDEFKKEGIEFLPSSVFLDNFIPKQKGVLTKRQPTAEELQNIDLGYKVSKTLAELDVGLTSVLSDRAVIALEGMEGTDECIKRAGELSASAGNKKSSLVVVKVARPQQDDRYDLPVIGKGTIRTMAQAGAKVLAVEAGKTIVLDIEEVIRLADEKDISVAVV